MNNNNNTETFEQFFEIFRSQFGDNWKRNGSAWLANSAAKAAWDRQQSKIDQLQKTIELKSKENGAHINMVNLLTDNVNELQKTISEMESDIKMLYESVLGCGNDCKFCTSLVSEIRSKYIKG